MDLPFDQVFAPYDLVTVGILVILEGVLSVDNALVLGLLARRLPVHQRARALTYGLVGAFVFRFVSIAVAQFLLKWTWVKLVGGAYLLYVAAKFFLFEYGKDQETKSGASPHGPHSTDPGAAADAIGVASFWPTVAVIELTDIAFAVDSILAAIALVGSAPSGHTGFHPRLWVVVTGGMLGVVLMRFAAVIFIKMLEKFPRFEVSAYLLVAVIGGKLTADWGFNTHEHHRLDFHDWTHPAFWVFWGLMLVFFLIGFIPVRKQEPAA